MGPPLAVAVYMELENPQQPDKPRKFRHVIAIPTASGKAQTSIDDALTPTGN